MPKLKNGMPKNCRDRNQAFSWYNGKRIYHGVWGTPEAEKSYKRFLAALIESPVPPAQVDKDTDVLVSELASAFLDDHESRMGYADFLNFGYAIEYLAEAFGELAANEFSPKKLKTVRSQMVKAGTLCRDTVNKYTKYLIRIFAWGVEEELVNANVAHGLRVVKSLREGEEGTFDHKEREPVPDDVIRRTLPFMPPTLRAMIQLQRLLGMRPNEIFKMRVGDIDRSRGNGLWYYVPGSYKTSRYVGKIIFPLGEPEQKLIAPYLIGKKSDEAIFSPRTAMAERNAERKANRKTKITPSQVARNKERAAKPSYYAEFYNRDSYRKAINYAIQKGNRQLPDGEKIPHWYPYLLRNSAATAIELENGLDEAQAQLGHTKADMTKRYSKAQLKQREKLAHSRVNPFEKPAENPSE
ncbi:MAG: site-specific integrase [Planctomycetaceae bacterium]|jgi:integrase|nr:site-specific integrase [Planctomycetaceae bacterium]